MQLQRNKLEMATARPTISLKSASIKHASTKHAALVAYFLSSILVATLPACADEENQVSSSKPSAPLQGGVSHFEQIEPLQPEFRAGATYDGRRASQSSAQDFWYQIPPWSAGLWHAEVSRSVDQNDDDDNDGSKHHSRLGAFGNYMNKQSESSREETHVARHDENWGFQRDRNGGIWQFAKTNYSTRTDGDSSYIISFVRSKSVLKDTSSEIQIRYVGTQMNIDTRTNRIISSSQVESVQTYTQVGADGRRNVALTKSFDENGKPTGSQKITTIQKRIKPFQIRNQLDGRDMYKSFVSYLKRNDLNDLVPDANTEDQ
jgi:hypothetical protein